MSVYRDKNGVTYSFPERSCKRCLKYPCLDNMEILLSDFAKYGCIYWSDPDVYKINSGSI